ATEDAAATEQTPAQPPTKPEAQTPAPKQPNTVVAKNKAREVYGDLQNQHLRLLNGLETAALSLLECEQDEQAIHSAKLVQSIKAFNLMTPDYTKLCTVLNDYLSKLPLLDMLSCDNDIDSGATSLKLSAEYLVDVTSRNLQYNSREHFDFAILFFLYMGFCYFITNF
ncbi:MAG: DUF6094 domain-containing protein, partial [Defluviitaleaceae bacterium]|nr:DUF6094 domain-containing protein [Defluviitaleaceae bacterium]